MICVPTKTILDLNNDAVSYLCQGNHTATTSTLRAAIQTLEQSFRQQDESTPCAACAGSSAVHTTKKRRRSSMGASVVTATAVPSAPSTTKQQGDFVAIRSITVTNAAAKSPASTHKGSISANNTTTVHSSCSSINEDTSLLMVYDRAFEFPSVVEDDNKNNNMTVTSSHQSRTRLAAILLYNLGLSYHREGIRRGQSSDLSMALQCYREAYTVLKSAWANHVDFKDVFVLLIALLNNIACIHCTVSDRKETHQCISWMNRAIASRQRSILSKEDYTFFSLNLSVFRGHQMRLASAA